MIEVLLIVGVVLIGYTVAVFFGFWMGRQTVEKPIQLTPPDRTGGQPLFEEDVYADAMRHEKSEGSL